MGVTVVKPPLIHLKRDLLQGVGMRMAACGAWKYRNVTPSVYQHLQTLGKQYGASIPGSASGRFSLKVSGIQVGFSYSWDVRTGVLVLVCESKPVLVSCSLIKNAADKIMSDSGARPF